MHARSTAQVVDRDARRSSTLAWSVRAGLVGYGAVHLLVAWVVVRLVLAGGSGTATSKGALAQLAGDPAGRAALAMLAVGFAALVIWQLVTALVGYRDRSGLPRMLMRLGAAGRVVVYGYFAVASAGLALGGRSAGGGTPDSTTATVMSLPAGPLLVAVAGLTVAGIGAGLAVFGWNKGFLGQLDERARRSERRTSIVVVGRTGYVVKGLAFVVLGGLLCWAAISHDPQKSGGLDQALHEVLGGLPGTVAVVVVGVGIGCFGLYLVARSWHLDEDSLTS
jgi:hypothetical protein